MSVSEDDRRAYRRFMVLNLIRLVGAALILTGIAILQRALDWPPVLAYVLTIVGVLVFFMLPRSLAKGWRSENE